VEVDRREAFVRRTAGRAGDLRRRYGRMGWIGNRFDQQKRPAMPGVWMFHVEPN
jgi:hypothetical protein